MDTVPVEFVTKTKLPRLNEATGRIETVTYEPHAQVQLPPVDAGYVIGNGWARKVSNDA